MLIFKNIVLVLCFLFMLIFMYEVVLGNWFLEICSIAFFLLKFFMCFYFEKWIDVVLRCICYLLVNIGILLAVAFFTLFERKVMASVQRRIGPRVVGFYGILQPFADGLKLVLKEFFIPKEANKFLFFLAPIFSFVISLFSWSVMPLTFNGLIGDVSLSILFVVMVSSLNIYGLVIAGWSSNSKYALLGALRSVAQIVSYEISLGFVILSVAILTSSLSFLGVMEAQREGCWLILPAFPLFMVFIIIMLAETNRAPFDLAEAEAEVVAGYHVEYGSIQFAFFFLAEYANMLLMSVIVIIFFFGGWYFPYFYEFKSFFSLILILKSVFFMSLFVFVRAALPRMRFDQLMSLGWKGLLPFCFSYTLFLAVYVLWFFFLPYIF